MKYALSVSDLRKTYKSKGEIVEALKGISFEVRKGEIFGLLGPNGAGKTTTVNILTGVLTADSGRIKFFGKNPCEETQNRINTATAYNALNGVLTVSQNLRVYAKIYNVKDWKEKIDNLLEKFEIGELRNRRVYDLSSGQKTRVNLCKCLINSPDLLFLDEATAGLDPSIAFRVRKEIKRLGMAIVFTSHIMHEVEELCSRIAFLHNGKIFKVGTAKALKKLVKEEHVFVIEFLSQPKTADKILKEFEVVFRKKNKIAVRLKKRKDIQTIIHRLVSSGFEIKDLHVKRPTLEDVFIKIARGEL